MNSHKNARLTFEGRKLLIERIAVMGLTPAAEAAGVSLRTARKWRERFDLPRAFEGGVARGADVSIDQSHERPKLIVGLLFVARPAQQFGKRLNRERRFARGMLCLSEFEQQRELH